MKVTRGAGHGKVYSLLVRQLELSVLVKESLLDRRVQNSRASHRALLTPHKENAYKTGCFHFYTPLRSTQPANDTRAVDIFSSVARFGLVQSFDRCWHYYA